MKKGLLLFAAVSMLAAFTACGSSENPDQKETQAEYGMPQENTESAAHENGNENGTFTEAENSNSEAGSLEAENQEAENPEDNEALAAYEYETDVIRYREPILGKFTFRKDVKKTETDYAVYYFEASIGEQERQACIAATERALSCIDGVVPKIEAVVLMPENYDGVSVSDHRLYTSLKPEEFTEFLAECLLAAYGEWGNYGFAYGYADYLCRKAGMHDVEAASYDRADGGFLPMSSPEPYDLNLLCFDERFVSPEDAEAARNNACCFVNEYLSAHSEEEFLKLLSDSGTAEGVGRANEALGAFYAENGADCSLTEIRYRYGGVTFDYAACCEYARFYLEKDWQEMHWEASEKISENFLHEDYAEVKAFYECNARQMGQYQEFFGFAGYNNDLPITLTNDFDMPLTMSGIYYPDSHSIYVRSVLPLMHEYIHSVMFGNFNWESLWKREGSARYFSYKYDDYFYQFYDDLVKYYEDDAEPAREVFSAIGSFFGRTPDIKTDFRVFDDMSAYIYGWCTDPDMSYEAASSFVGYLVDQYGEKAVIEYICSEDEYNAQWGKSYEELVQDWNEYIEENYSWYERK